MHTCRNIHVLYLINSLFLLYNDMSCKYTCTCVYSQASTTISAAPFACSHGEPGKEYGIVRGGKAKHSTNGPYM